MKQGSTLFLQATVLLLGLVVLTVSALVLIPALFKEDDAEFIYILIGLLTTTIPFFIALLQTMRLLGFINRNQAFSDLSVTALRNIKYCGLAISALFTAMLPAFFYIADTDDAPGVMAIGLVFTFAALVVAVFAAVLERLLRSAIDIKSENDLTV